MTRSRSDRGFTLMEVLVALAIVATTLLVLQGIVGSNIDRADLTRSKRTARFLARAQLEKAILGLETGQSGEFEGYDGYRWTIEETQAPVAETETVRQVTIVVTYPVPGVDPSAPPPPPPSPDDPSAGDAPGRYTITTLLDPKE